PDSSEAFRNADIKTYLSAIHEIESRGMKVVRIGDPSMSDIADMPSVVDYAHSEYRSGLMDCLLIASSSFLLCTSSGPVAVAQILGVGVCMTNLAPIGLNFALQN